MRVSDAIRFQMVNRSLSSLGQRQLTAAEQAQTGRRVSRPSDDPIAAAELARVESALQRNNNYQKTVAHVRGDVELSEGVLGEAGDILQRIRALATQGANDTLGSGERETLADEVAGLKEQLVGLANTKGSRGYLFGGNQTTTTPFDGAGAFSGDDGIHSVEIGNGVQTRVNISGAQAFTAAGGTDVFAVMDSLETALRANDTTAIAGSLTGVDAAHQQVQFARADAGLLLGRLDTADAALTQGNLSLNRHGTDVGAADAFEAFTELNAVSASIEQAIAVARQTLSSDLVRF